MLPIHFAPLQGYTDDVYRRAHCRICGGVAQYYTPFLRVEHGAPRDRDIMAIAPQHNEGVPLAVQFIARDAEEMRILLDAVRAQDVTTAPAQDANTAPAHARRHIDINMGCPFPLQVRHGRGAGILPQPEKVAEVCRFVSEAAAPVPPSETRLGAEHAPTFSVKMRLGAENADEWRAVLPLLNDTPLTHITLHPRVATQQYGGTPDMEAFEAFIAECRHPVVYNGDVTSADDIRSLEERYPTLAGVMIGRGLLARPTLAAEYRDGRTCSDEEVVAAILRLHDAVFENYARRYQGNDPQMLSKLRTFWDYHDPSLGLGGSDAPIIDRKVWKKIHKAGSMRNYLQAVGALR